MKAQENQQNAVKMKIESNQRLDERENNLKDEFEKRVKIVE